MGSRGTVTVPSGGVGVAEIGVGILVDVGVGEVGSAAGSMEMEEVGVRRGGSTSVAQASPVSPKNNSSITEDNWYM